MSASVSSRELLEVSSTSGCVRASTTPSSGIEIWKSESTSRSIASNSWSVLSISSIRSTTGSSVVMAFRSGRASRKSSPKMSSLTSFQPVSAASVWMRSSCLR